MEGLLGHLIARIDVGGGGATVAQYSSLIGINIEVLYHAWGLDLRAFGILLYDSGTFIILEQHFDRTKTKYQLKLPYDCIINIEQT
jgi:hypothetical protein